MIKTVLSREGKKIWMVTKRIDGIKWYIGTYSSREEAVEISRLIDMNKNSIQEGKIYDTGLF